MILFGTSDSDRADYTLRGCLVPRFRTRKARDGGTRLLLYVVSVIHRETKIGINGLNKSAMDY